MKMVVLSSLWGSMCLSNSAHTQFVVIGCFNDITLDKNIRKVNDTSFMCIVLLTSDVPVSTCHRLVVQHVKTYTFYILSMCLLLHCAVASETRVIKSVVDWL